MLPADDDNQKEVIAFLAAPQTYGETVDVVERCETHGAIVFLAGDKAYKLKRAVRYPYLDYSTAERRRDMCERELAVNRRTAPEIYLDVVAIVRKDDGELGFGTADSASILDWVVVMRRFDQDDLLEQMRLNGRLTAELMHQLAEAVAEFHRRAEICPGYGGPTAAADIVAENLAAFEAFSGRPFEPNRITHFRGLSETMLGRAGHELELRRVQGRVRRCHGDLHLNNICVIDGRPVLFDAIEFNEEFACIDVFYDLAFLLMDLDRHGLQGFANTVLNRYLEVSADYGGVSTLPLFLSCRAAIRAHVAATAAGLMTANAQEKLEESRFLFDRALAYLEPAGARLIAIGGASGTGKSTLARAIAPTLGPAPGAIVLRSDVIRKRLMGVGTLTRLPSAAYRAEVTEKVYAEIEKLSAKILAAGHSVIADAVYGIDEERRRLENVAHKAGVPFDGLWLEADPHLLEDRISARARDASDATVAVLRQQLEIIEKPLAWTRIDASGPPPLTAANARRSLRP